MSSLTSCQLPSKRHGGLTKRMPRGYLPTVRHPRDVANGLVPNTYSNALLLRYRPACSQRLQLALADESRDRVRFTAVVAQPSCCLGRSRIQLRGEDPLTKPSHNMDDATLKRLIETQASPRLLIADRNGGATIISLKACSQDSTFNSLIIWLAAMAHG